MNLSFYWYSRIANIDNRCKQGWFIVSNDVLAELRLARVSNAFDLKIRLSTYYIWKPKIYSQVNLTEPLLVQLVAC